MIDKKVTMIDHMIEIITTDMEADMTKEKKTTFKKNTRHQGITKTKNTKRDTRNHLLDHNHHHNPVPGHEEAEAEITEGIMKIEIGSTLKGKIEKKEIFL